MPSSRGAVRLPPSNSVRKKYQKKKLTLCARGFAVARPGGALSPAPPPSPLPTGARLRLQLLRCLAPSGRRRLRLLARPPAHASACHSASTRWGRRRHQAAPLPRPRAGRPLTQRFWSPRGHPWWRVLTRSVPWLPQPLPPARPRRPWGGAFTRVRASQLGRLAGLTGAGQMHPEQARAPAVSPAPSAAPQLLVWSWEPSGRCLLHLQPPNARAASPPGTRQLWTGGYRGRRCGVSCDAHR